jgi:hypothetical protein
MKMPLRIHKYDRPEYRRVLTPQQRKVRKAFYYAERLMQIDPLFSNEFKQIRNQFKQQTITSQQADTLTAKAIQEALQRQKLFTP